MGRDVHDENVADAPARAKARLPLRNGTQQLIGMKASFHEQFSPTGADQLNCLVRRSLAVWYINQFEIFDTDAKRSRNVERFCF